MPCASASSCSSSTFLIYWLLGPMQTAYDFQLSQANNIVHGHLDMDPAYTNNLTILERVLFDGEGFCLPLPDPRAAQGNTYTIPVQQTADCRHFMQHSLGPAFLLAPLAFFFGLTVNQTLISALIGALAAPVVWGITRRFSDHLPTQLALTALAMFGTTFFYSAADGSVWHFAHTTAVFFTFCAIYATVVIAQSAARRRVRRRRVHVPADDDPGRILPARRLLRHVAGTGPGRRHERLATAARAHPAAAVGQAGRRRRAIRAADDGDQLPALRPAVRIGLQLHRADLPGRPGMGLPVRHLRPALRVAPHPDVLRADAESSRTRALTSGRRGRAWRCGRFHRRC